MPVNSRTGQRYTVQPTTGGVYHVYPDGRRVFVRKSTSTNPAANPGATVNGQPAPTASLPAFSPDSAYVNQNAMSQWQLGNQRSDLLTEQQYDQADYDEYLRRLDPQETETQEQNAVRSNDAGLFYSGAHNKARADTLTTFARMRADALQGFTRRSDQRSTGLKRLEEGYELDDRSAMGDARGRWQERMAQLAASNQLAVNPVVPTPGVAPRAPSAPRPQVIAQRPQPVTTTIRRPTVRRPRRPRRR